MRNSTAVQLLEEPRIARVPFALAAGLEDEDEGVPVPAGPEVFVKGISVDVRATDLRLADALAAYLNALAQIELDASEEKSAEIGKKQSRRSMLGDSLHFGLLRRVKLIEKAAGEPLPMSEDPKAMRTYAARVLVAAKTKASKRG